jgi:hypothetical protein
MMVVNRFAFILRLWQEAPDPTAENESGMRGSLQMANSEDVFYFHSLEQVPGLLEKLMEGVNTAVTPPPSNPE